jgi:hypothetical protein
MGKLKYVECSWDDAPKEVRQLLISHPFITKAKDFLTSASDASVSCGITVAGTRYRLFTGHRSEKNRFIELLNDANKGADIPEHEISAALKSLES